MNKSLLIASTFAVVFLTIVLYVLPSQLERSILDKQQSIELRVREIAWSESFQSDLKNFLEQLSTNKVIIQEPIVWGGGMKQFARVEIPFQFSEQEETGSLTVSKFSDSHMRIGINSWTDLKNPPWREDCPQDTIAQNGSRRITCEWRSDRDHEILPESLKSLLNEVSKMPSPVSFGTVRNISNKSDMLPVAISTSIVLLAIMYYLLRLVGLLKTFLINMFIITPMLLYLVYQIANAGGIFRPGSAADFIIGIPVLFIFALIIWFQLYKVATFAWKRKYGVIKEGDAKMIKLTVFIVLAYIPLLPILSYHAHGSPCCF